MRATTLKLRVSDDELAAIDAARGLATRSAYLRSLLPSQPEPAAVPAKSRAVAACAHDADHDWQRANQYLDRCSRCVAERPHQMGTK